jgi:hypothetical protein
VGSFILLQTLLQIGFAFGVGKFLSGFILSRYSTIGLALKLVTTVIQVLKLVELITHPKPILASSLVASFETDTSVRGHAKTLKAMGPELFKIVFPGRGRAIWVILP